MSYYVTWDCYSLKTKHSPEKMKKLEEEYYNEHQSLIGGFVNEYHPDGTFDMIDVYLKAHEDNDYGFIQFLANHYEGELYLNGDEEGDNQRITMQADGEFKIEYGQLIYGELIDEVLAFYDLPENLKNELLNFNTARKI